jgi:hypothetical protein
MSRSKSKKKSTRLSIAAGRSANSRGTRNELRCLELLRGNLPEWATGARSATDVEDACGWDIVLDVRDADYQVGVQVKSSKSLAASFLRRARGNGYERLPTAVIVVNKNKLDREILDKLIPSLETARLRAKEIWDEAPACIPRRPSDWQNLDSMTELLAWYGWRAKLGAASHRHAILGACRALCCTICHLRAGKRLTVLVRDKSLPNCFGIGKTAQARMRDNGKRPSLEAFLAEVAKHKPVCRRCLERLRKAG